MTTLSSTIFPLVGLSLASALVLSACSTDLAPGTGNSGVATDAATSAGALPAKVSDELFNTVFIDKGDLSSDLAQKAADLFSYYEQLEADAKDIEDILAARQELRDALSVIMEEVELPQADPEEVGIYVDEIYAEIDAIEVAAEEDGVKIDDGGVDGSSGPVGAAPPYQLFSSWPDHHLAWCFEDETTDSGMSYADQAFAFARAYGKWDGASPVDFEPTGCGTDIEMRIGFHTGYHWDFNWALDTESFDGPGGTLAHGFFPTFGYIHFDDDETWDLTGSSGVDLETVALHEIGHAMGLLHEDAAVTVMNTFYTGTRRLLTSDDIAGIQDLYDGPDDLCAEAYRNAQQAITRLAYARALVGIDYDAGISAASPVMAQINGALYYAQSSHDLALDASFGVGDPLSSSIAAHYAAIAESATEVAGQDFFSYMSASANGDEIFRLLLDAASQATAAEQASLICSGTI